MLLFLFMHLVVRWIIQIIFYLIYVFNLISVLIFALSPVWRFLYAVLRFLQSSCMDFMRPVFLGNDGQHMPVCLEMIKMISSWVREVISMAVVHMSQGTLQGAAASAALVAGVSLVVTSQQVTGPEFLLQLDTIFNIYHYYRLAPGSCAACCPWP